MITGIFTAIAAAVTANASALTIFGGLGYGAEMLLPRLTRAHRVARGARKARAIYKTTFGKDVPPETEEALRAAAEKHVDEFN